MPAQSGFTILHSFPPADVLRDWHDGLRRVDFPSHYNAPEFFLEPYWTGKQPFAILALTQGAVTGILTGIHEGDHVTSGLPSRPQICVDAAVDPNGTLDSLARGLLAEAGSAKLVTVYSWSWRPLNPFERYGFRRRDLEGNVVLDLTQGSEALFRQFPADRRRNIRFAIRNGVEVTQASTIEDFLAYYEVYSEWCKRKGNQPFPFQWEELAFHSTQGNRRLFLARLSGKVIAGNIFRFYPGGMFESARNNSLQEFLQFKPNDLLQWRGIEWACREGLRRHSLGGAHFFLRRFGGTVVPVYRYRLDRTLLRQHDRREATLDAARRIFRRLPQPVQKRVRSVFGKRYYVP